MNRQSTSVQSVRDRSCLSFERSHIRRFAQKRILLLVDDLSLNYFKDYISSSGLQNQVMVVAATPEKAVVVCHERYKKEGPFQRIYLIMASDGQPSSPAHIACQEMQNSFPPPMTIHIQLIEYKPSFDFWILLHFAEPGPDAHDAAQLKTQVETWLAKHSLNHKNQSLFDLTAPFLDQAMQRSLKLTREQQLLSTSERLDQPGSEIHIMISFLKKLARSSHSAPP